MCLQKTRFLPKVSFFLCLLPLLPSNQSITFPFQVAKESFSSATCSNSSSSSSNSSNSKAKLTKKKSLFPAPTAKKLCNFFCAQPQQAMQLFQMSITFPSLLFFFLFLHSRSRWITGKKVLVNKSCFTPSCLERKKRCCRACCLFFHCHQPCWGCCCWWWCIRQRGVCAEEWKFYEEEGGKEGGREGGREEKKEAGASAEMRTCCGCIRWSSEDKTVASWKKKREFPELSNSWRGEEELKSWRFEELKSWSVEELKRWSVEGSTKAWNVNLESWLTQAWYTATFSRQDLGKIINTTTQLFLSHNCVAKSQVWLLPFSLSPAA